MSTRARPQQQTYLPWDERGEKDWNVGILQPIVDTAARLTDPLGCLCVQLIMTLLYDEYKTGNADHYDVLAMRMAQQHTENARNAEGPNETFERMVGILFKKSARDSRMHQRAKSPESDVSRYRD